MTDLYKPVLNHCQVLECNAPTEAPTTTTEDPTEAPTAVPTTTAPPTASSYYFYTVTERIYSYALDMDWNEGDEIRISNVCSPDFNLGMVSSYPGSENLDCDWAARQGFCRTITKVLLSNSVEYYPDNGLVTFLNCPSCGCVDNQPISLQERDNLERTVENFEIPEELKNLLSSI